MIPSFRDQFASFASQVTIQNANDEHFQGAVQALVKMIMEKEKDLIHQSCASVRKAINTGPAREPHFHNLTKDKAKTVLAKVAEIVQAQGWTVSVAFEPSSGSSAYLPYPEAVLAIKVALPKGPEIAPINDSTRKAFAKFAKFAKKTTLTNHADQTSEDAVNNILDQITKKNMDLHYQNCASVCIAINRERDCQPPFKNLTKERAKTILAKVAQVVRAQGWTVSVAFEPSSGSSAYLPYPEAVLKVRVEIPQPSNASLEKPSANSSEIDALQKLLEKSQIENNHVILQMNELNVQIKKLKADIGELQKENLHYENALERRLKTSHEVGEQIKALLQEKETSQQRLATIQFSLAEKDKQITQLADEKMALELQLAEKQEGQGISCEIEKIVSDMSELFNDPITLETLEDPVLAAGSGHTYSKASLEGWLKRSRTDPTTRAHLSKADLHANRLVDSLIPLMQQLKEQIEKKS